MKSIFPVPLFEHVGIVENREYVKFFDESVNVYNEHYNKTFPFYLEFDYNTCSGKLEIPDCGGHVDSVPSSTMQLAWTESALSDLCFEQTWATSWNILSIESYSKFIEKLLECEAEIKSLYYQCDMFTLKTVISCSIEIGQPICHIFCYDNNNLSKTDVNDEMNENLHSLLLINSDDQFFGSLSRIMKNDDLSKSATFRVDFLC